MSLERQENLGVLSSCKKNKIGAELKGTIISNNSRAVSLILQPQSQKLDAHFP